MSVEWCGWDLWDTWDLCEPPGLEPFLEYFVSLSVKMDVLSHFLTPTMPSTNRSDSTGLARPQRNRTPGRFPFHFSPFTFHFSRLARYLSLLTSSPLDFSQRIPAADDAFLRSSRFRTSFVTHRPPDIPYLMTAKIWRFWRRGKTV